MNPTDNAFIELLAAKRITVQAESQNQLNSLRVMLYRKLQDHIHQWDQLGFLNEELRGCTVSMDVSKDGTTATFEIIKKKPRLKFTIISIGSETANGQTVPTDLEHDKSCKVQHGSSYSRSQDDGEDVDSSSAEGESSGQRSSPEDWQSIVRQFIESDSGRSEEC